MTIPSPAITIAPACCPLCGQPNRCAMEVERETGERQPPCWCAAVKIPPALLEQVPVNARQLACVCQVCATRDTSA